MNVSFSDAAYAKIIDVAEFIDDINTPGAGDRWITKTIAFIEEYAKLKQVRGLSAAIGIWQLWSIAV